MKSLLTFNLGRRGRALAALALAVVALAILLLGVGSELPTVSASTLPPARPENVTAAITYWVYLPILFHTTVPPVNWVDHFTNSKSGWIASGDGCTGEYDTDKGVYRVKISSGHKYDSCIIWNSKTGSSNPLGAFPRQFYGTFIARVRRTTSDSYPLLYGFQFDTAANSTDTNGTRWALEEWPQSTDTGCSDGKGFYWLTAQQYKSSTSNTSRYYSADKNGADVSGCTSTIDLDQNDWNQMIAIRDGSTVSVYLNNYDDDGDIDKTYHHDFTNVPSITPKDPSEPLGWFQMRVVPYSSSAVTVEFDRVEIHSSTTAPW
jgi:hypothetical protein